MADPQVTRLKIGSRVWWHGDYWEIRGFVDGLVQLTSRDQAATVAIADLARSSLSETSKTEQDVGTLNGSAALTSLTAQERDRVDALATTIRGLLDDSSSLEPRIRATAKELGVSHRSLERRISAYRQLGVAGLVDSRSTGTRASRIDPRWDEVCMKVLRSYTYASTPTKSAVIAQIARELVETYGPEYLVIELAIYPAGSRVPPNGL